MGCVVLLLFVSLFRRQAQPSSQRRHNERDPDVEGKESTDCVARQGKGKTEAECQTGQGHSRWSYGPGFRTGDGGCRAKNNNIK
jgi:hypothetical protein